MFRIKLETPTPENCQLVALTQGKYAIVDIDVDPVIWKFKWRAIKWNYRWYAYSTTSQNGTSAHVAMHRLIAATATGEICHHANGHSLDNRIGNLMNMMNSLHSDIHHIRRWGHEKKVKTSKKRQ